MNRTQANASRLRVHPPISGATGKPQIAAYARRMPRRGGHRRLPARCILRWHALATVLPVLLLAACAAQPPAPVEDRTAQDRRSVEERVRAPAETDAAGGLQVYALRNPAVDELLSAARQAEDEGDLDRAAILLERALRIQSRDPEVLQRLAEVHLAKGNWSQAESHATRSFDVGPRLGELCARNWRTLEVARERLDDRDGAEQARRRAAECAVDRPPRT